ncbi:hypothetical protein TrCOL_g2975 [Triparma columacea]|uniref:Uncharacterized protein n=1 Tax=Triparma columacea TaxID=722753 RepID=A0A9W7G4Q3_9STRA|nr:hypothetical protein TrCOL_g2975 [Triparma columacea]
MAQGSNLKPTKRSKSKQIQKKQIAKVKRENKKGSVNRTSKGAKAIRNMAGEQKQLTRKIDSTNMKTFAARALMSGGGRFFLSEVTEKGQKEMKELKRVKQKSTGGEGKLENRIDKQLRKLGGVGGRR